MMRCVFLWAWIRCDSFDTLVYQWQEILCSMCHLNGLSVAPNRKVAVSIDTISKVF